MTQSSRPMSRMSKYFNFDIPSGKFNSEWAFTLIGVQSSDETNLKRISSECNMFIISVRRNKRHDQCIRAFFKFNYEKQRSLLDREMEYRGTWGIPLKDAAAMYDWAAKGSIIDEKKGSSGRGGNGGKRNDRKHKSPARSRRHDMDRSRSSLPLPSVVSPAPIQPPPIAKREEPKPAAPAPVPDTTAGDKDLQYFKAMFITRQQKKPRPQDLAQTRNFYIHGANSDDFAFRIAARISPTFYVKDESPYWDDYNGEKVILILGLSKANAKKYSALPQLMDTHPRKMPGKYWPVWVNPVCVVVGAADLPEIVFGDFGGLWRMFEGKIETINAGVTAFENIAIPDLAQLDQSALPARDDRPPAPRSIMDRVSQRPSRGRSRSRSHERPPDPGFFFDAPSF